MLYSNIELNEQQEYNLDTIGTASPTLHGNSFANIQYPLTAEEVGSTLSCKLSMFD